MSERLNDLTQRLHQVGERLRKAQPQSAGVISDEILHQLDQVIDQLREHSGAGYQEGHDWVVQIFTHLPQLNPVIDRDILWYFGGDCLHFLTDDEIEPLLHEPVALPNPFSFFETPTIFCRPS